MKVSRAADVRGWVGVRWGWGGVEGVGGGLQYLVARITWWGYELEK